MRDLDHKMDNFKAAGGEVVVPGRGDGDVVLDAHPAHPAEPLDLVRHQKLPRRSSASTLTRR